VHRKVALFTVAKHIVQFVR